MKRQFTDEFEEVMNRMYAAMRVKKAVQIKLRRGCAARQQSDLEIIMDQCKKVISATSREEIMTHTGIAVGYANAMQQHNLISNEELQDLINMLDEIGEDRMKIVDEMDKTSFPDCFERR